MNAPLVPPLTDEQVRGMDDMAEAMEQEDRDRRAEHRAEEHDYFNHGAEE